jgi:hypothetical protein
MADPTIASKVQRQADQITIASGGKLKIEQGGVIELNQLNLVADVTLAAAAGGTNVCEVTITMRDNQGNAVVGVYNFDLWLSDNITGEGLTATTASGSVDAKTNSGTVIGTYVAKKALRAQTLITGVFVLSITDSAKTPFKVCVQIPGVSRQRILILTGANYG